MTKQLLFDCIYKDLKDVKATEAAVSNIKSSLRFERKDLRSIVDVSNYWLKDENGTIGYDILYKNGSIYSVESYCEYFDKRVESVGV